MREQLTQNKTEHEMNNMTVTFYKMNAVKDEAMYAMRIAQEVKAMGKLRSKGHRDWKNVSDEVILNCARAIVQSCESSYTKYVAA